MLVSSTMRTTGMVLFVCHFLSRVSLVQAQDTFNFEIAARVIDKISAFTYIIERALDIPVKLALSGSFPLNNASITAPAILFPARNGIPDFVGSCSLCQANGHFYGYPAEPTYPRGFGFVETFPPLYTNASTYLVNNDGTRGQLQKLSTYECGTRGWYKESKSLGYSTWSSPNLSPVTGQFGLFLQYPIFNTTYIDSSGEIKISAGSKKFIATILVVTYLSNIVTFLSEAYKNSDRKVFLVDKPTGILLASSFDAVLTSKSVAGKTVAVIAASSLDTVIAGSMKEIKENGCDTRLVIFEDYYLQCVTYVDTIPGLSWYVMVLLPATIEETTIQLDSPLFFAVVTIASVALFSTFMGIFSTLVYFKSKLIKLTQPYFTLLNLFGGFMLAISTLLILGDNNLSNCGVRPYVFNLGFTLAFSPLLIKAWRVDRVFNTKVMTKNKMIPVWQLIGYTLSFIVVDVIILVTTLYSRGRGTGPKTYLKLGVSGAYQNVTICEYTDNSDLFYAEIVYKGVLVLSACILSFRVRNVAGSIAGSKMLLAVVYNTAFISALVIIITQSIKDLGTIIMTQALGICFCVIMNVILLVVPHIYQILSVGDHAATEDAMNEIFQGKQIKKTPHMSIKSPSHVNSADVSLMINNTENRPSIAIVTATPLEKALLP